MRDRRLAALLVGLIGFATIAGTVGSTSIAWDEAIYMRSARRYVAWADLLRHDPAGALSKTTLTEYWGVAAAGQAGVGGVEDIHPPLMKIAAGLSWRVLHGAVGDLLGFRLVSAGLFGLALALLALWVSNEYGLPAGIAAALCLGLMPRFFDFAHLLALDVPLAVLSLAATYVYRKTVDHQSWRWAIPFGLLWGIALGTKNGGWLLPLGLGIWTILFRRTWRTIVRLGLSMLVAAAVFLVSWPWLWYDSATRIASYAQFAFLGHADLLGQYTYYLGRIYQTPPWHYPLVITAVVLPLSILVLVLAGLAAVVGDGQRASTGWLFVLSAAVPMMPFVFGLVAAYDGERLFLPAFPFLAALGGLGFARIVAALWSVFWRIAPRLAARRQGGAVRGVAAAILATILFAPPALSIARLHPYELAYYSEIVGGVAGAQQAGFETTFWADSYQGTLDFLNQNVPAKATVWADAYQVLWAYQDIGRLRKDIFVPGSDTSDPQAGEWAVVQTRQSRYTPAVTALTASRQPEFVVRAAAVILAGVYRVR